MKKHPRSLKTLGCFMMVCSLLAGCSTSSKTSETSSTSVSDESKAVALEEVRGCIADETSCQSYQEEQSILALADEFTPMSFEEAISFFEEGKSGLLYFGFPDCPWCQEILPLLSASAKENGVEVHYVQTRDDNRELLYTPEQKERIIPYLQDYMSENDKGELTLYVPLLVEVENGTAVKGHQGTVDGHDAHERKMTDEEKEQAQSLVDEIVSDVAKQSK